MSQRRSQFNLASTLYSLIGVAAWLLLLCALAQANTEICGDGIDNDSSGGAALCSVSTWPNDQDHDGFATDSNGIMSLGYGTVNGAQSTVNTITINSGHTFLVGQYAHFFDSVSAGNVDRFIQATTDTSIVISGAAVTVTNGESITTKTRVDCDDTDRYIYPGIYTTTGCSAGQVHRCQDDGTYTSCKNISALSNSDMPTGSLNTYFIDPALTPTDCSGSGTYGSPWGYLCFSNTGLTGYHAPVAGDTFIFLSGTGSASTWSATPPRQIYVLNKDCTETNPCRIIGIGTTRPKITGGGTTGTNTEIRILDIENSDWWELYSLELDGTSGYENAGVYWNQSDHGVIQNMSTHNINGRCGCNNIAGIKIADADFTYVDHNLSYDNYNTLATTTCNVSPGCGGATVGWKNENNYAILFFSSGPEGARFNILYNQASGPSTTDGAGHLLAIKHGCQGASCTIQEAELAYNILLGGSYYSDIVADTKNVRIHHNIIDGVNKGTVGFPFDHRDLGGNCQLDGAKFYYNTILHAPFWHSYIDCATVGSSSVLASDHNVVVDDKNGNYNGDYTDGFIRNCYYCSDTIYTNHHSKVTSDYNCMYNSTAHDFGATDYGDAGTGNSANGVDYPSSGSAFTNWKAAGFDTHSYFRNPNLSTNDQVAQDASCSTFGYSQGLATPQVNAPLTYTNPHRWRGGRTSN